MNNSLNIFYGIIFGFLVFQIYVLKWKNRYYYKEKLIDMRLYGEWNPFKRALRKIYRPKSISDMPYDIYILTKVDRFKKIRTYQLASMDDDIEFTNSLKRNRDERHETKSTESVS